MTDFTELNESIIRALSNKPIQLDYIYRGEVRRIANAISEQRSTLPTTMIQIRLNFLRKQGRVDLIRGKGWILKKKSKPKSKKA